MNMKHLYTSLGSGVTSGSVTDNSITDDSVIEIYFDNTDCYIDSTSQSGHTVYFTVGGNATGTNVCVVVNNLTNFTPYDDTNIVNRVGSLESEVETLDNVVTTLETDVETLETDVETLETRVDGLNASNINYDAHSTLYSAMGDIDELETTSKNLVGAINEVKESGGGGEVYDTTEHLIGTWFDKNLYRKLCVINQTSYIVGGGSTIGITEETYPIGIDKLVNARYSNNAHVFYNFTQVSKEIYPTFYATASPQITIRNSGFIILEYTKVGD